MFFSSFFFFFFFFFFFQGTIFARAGEIEQEIFIVAGGTVSVFVEQDQLNNESNSYSHEQADQQQNQVRVVHDNNNLFQENKDDNQNKEEKKKKDENVLVTLGVGACIGERRLSALFFTSPSSHNKTQLRRETSARAITVCCLISVSLKKLASMFQASPTILRGVLSVLLLDLRRCYLYRMNQQHKIRNKQQKKQKNKDNTKTNNIKTNTNNSASGSASGSNSNSSSRSITPPLTPSASSAASSFNLYTSSSSRNLLNMKLSKLALKNNATNGMRHGSTAQNVRAAGRITSRLSLLELCICLKDVQAFQHLNNETIQMLAESAEQCLYMSNECIFVEGDPSTFVLIVIEGSCHLYNSSNVGSEHSEQAVVGRVGKGYLIGELSLIPSSPRLVTCSVGTFYFFVLVCLSLHTFQTQNSGILS